MSMTSAIIEDASAPGRLTLPMLVLTIFSALGGFLFGYDTGVVSGAMLLVREDFKLSTIWHEVIVSATIAAAWLTAMISGRLTDWLGRRRIIMTASLLFAVGSVVMAAAPEKVTLLTGRIIVGVAIGLASMVVPVYLSEVAETSVKGRLTVTNTLFVTGGQFAAGLVCGAFSGVSAGWRFMFGLAAVPAVIQLVGFMFLPESPRWLVSQGKSSEAHEVLVKFRCEGDDVDCELDQIIEAQQQEKTSVSIRTILIEHVSTRRALILGCLLQLFQQLAGINTVMYYSASIITMAGIGDPTTAIWLSAVVSSFNFFFTFIGLWLVERMGRRPLLLWSLLGVVIALLSLAVSFNVSYTNSPEITNNSTYSDLCSQYATCSTCTSTKECGFCFEDSDGLYSNATCLPTNSSQFNEISTLGPCNSNESHFTYAYDWCPSPNAWVAVVGLAFYLMAFAPGMGPMPWTINSEIFPGWARAQCVGMTTSVNWFSNLFVSLSFLTLTEALTKHGTFYLYACLASLGLVIFYLILPETKGTTLEDVHLQFKEPLFANRPKNRIKT